MVLDNPNSVEYFNQASMLLCFAINGENELAYMATNQPTDNRNVLRIYEGGGKLKQTQGARHAKYFEDGWTVSTTTDGYDSYSGTIESTFANLDDATLENIRLGTPAKVVDPTGRQYNFQYDSDAGSVTRKTYSDGSVETFAYNSFDQVTRSQDRLGRVTKQTYDAAGNMTLKEVGIINTKVFGQAAPDYSDPPIDVQVTVANGFDRDEFAQTSWQYYGDSEAVDGVVQPKGLLKYAFDALGNRTQNVYNADKLLWRVYEPDDTGTGYHVAQRIHLRRGQAAGHQPRRPRPNDCVHLRRVQSANQNHLPGRLDRRGPLRHRQ